MLRMDIDEPLAQLFELRYGHGGIVDKGARLTGGRELAAQDALVGIVLYIILLKKSGKVIVPDIEVSLDDGFLRGIGHDTYIGPLSQNERQRTQNDRLSGSGLTGYHRQPGLESNLHAVYQRIVANYQLTNHAVTCYQFSSLIFSIRASSCFIAWSK